MKNFPGLFRCIQVTHPMEDGAGRIVDILLGVPKWETGSMPMSGPNCCPLSWGCPVPKCCLWGALGDKTTLVDNREFASYLANKELYAPAAAKVREYVGKWHMNAMMPAKMERGEVGKKGKVPDLM